MIQQSALLIINFGLLVIEMNEKIKVRIEGDKKNNILLDFIISWGIDCRFILGDYPGFLPWFMLASNLSSSFCGLTSS